MQEQIPLDSVGDQPLTPSPHRFQEYAKLPLLNGVNIDQISTHLEQCEKVQFTAGELLLSPHNPNNKMFVILSGTLSVHISVVKNEPITLLKYGECVGEMSVFDGKEPSAYVVAEEDSCLLSIHRDILWTMVDTSHAIARNLLYFLSHRIRFGNDVYNDSLKSAKEHQEHANMDALTNLYNRRWINEKFQSEINKAHFEKRSLNLVMIDIDHFKLLNDRYGHLTGDEILKLVSSKMKALLRPGEMLARYGGEEFAILLPNTSTETAIRIAQRVRIGIEQCEYIDQPSGDTIHVTISAGISRLSNDDSLESLIQSADKSLYKAKDSGRNKVCY